VNELQRKAARLGKKEDTEDRAGEGGGQDHVAKERLQFLDVRISLIRISTVASHDYGT